jgi:isocitrate dehydrogenase (NAD+)
VSTEVTLIGGDSELVAAGRRAIDATGVGLAWEQPADEDADAVLESARRTRVVLQGPTGGGLAARVRSELGVHASVLHCKAMEGAQTRFPETDLVVVRERDTSGVAFKQADRVVRTACDYAREHDRHAVTAGHSTGEDRGPARDAAAAYGDLEFSDADVGDLCAGLVAHPEGHDVLVLPDLLGGIVGHLGAGMIGGLGLAPGRSVGEEAAVFEATHDGANPTALMLSGALMLRHLGEEDAADRLAAAIAGVIRRGEHVTNDLKPTRNDPSAVGTSEFADAVIEEMENQ